MDAKNFISTIKLDYDLETPMNNRAKLDTGTLCNYRCSFCYYKDRLKEFTPLDVIKQRVDYLVSCGIKEVDLSGGESSIHPDWFDILHYCLSKNLRISTLSNGSMFCDKTFILDSFNHGLKEILFSLHGYNAQTHNKMVGSDGYKDIIQAIYNAHELGIKVRINCLVTHDNYKGLPDVYPSTMKGLRPFEVNFLTMNCWDDVTGYESLSYEKSSETIKKCIDRMDVPIINVRYIPFCYMKGYERYVCDIYQHIYDPYDWNVALYDMSMEPNEYVKYPRRAMFDSARTKRSNSYYKKEECQTCKHFHICDGIDNGLNIPVYPEEGEPIVDVNYYRKGFYEV